MDAGTKAADHYAKLISPSRFWCRQHILNVIRRETPVLARLQAAVRNPVLDWYFAMTANIGTHTFYMIMLPVTFWYGDPIVGLDIVWVLALGVFLTGFVKDMLCLPRPMSPPLHRISMSGSAMLEYGMPSTHSCNAVSVSLVMSKVYPDNVLVSRISLWLLLTLILGRLYNGMHGFLDIIVGCVFGLLSYNLRAWIEARFDPGLGSDNLLITVSTILAISACPDPVDDCPCFDDSVSFAGVVLGLLWTLYVGISPHAPFNPQRFAGKPVWELALAGSLRFLVGVGCIVVWRHFSKRFLLRILPPIWRVLDQLGIQNPRRYFTPASEYSRVPNDLPDGNLPDSKVEVREMFSKFKQMKRSPSDLVGPQSEADLYELRARTSAESSKSLSASDPEIATEEKEISENTQLGEHANVEKLRKRYDVEVTMRLIVYGGIAPVALLLAPVIFALLHI